MNTLTSYGNRHLMDGSVKALVAYDEEDIKKGFKPFIEEVEKFWGEDKKKVAIQKQNKLILELREKKQKAEALYKESGYSAACKVNDMDIERVDAIEKQFLLTPAQTKEGLSAQIRYMQKRLGDYFVEEKDAEPVARWLDILEQGIGNI